MTTTTRIHEALAYLADRFWESDEHGGGGCLVPSRASRHSFDSMKYEHGAEANIALGLAGIGTDGLPAGETSGPWRLDELLAALVRGLRRGRYMPSKVSRKAIAAVSCSASSSRWRSVSSINLLCDHS